MNEVKTKCMSFGDRNPIELFFNGNIIEQVEKYKYLGVIIKSVMRLNQDVFAFNYEYLKQQARKALFCAQKKISSFGKLPPHIKMFLFDSLIKPILTYGSEVWAVSEAGTSQADKTFLRHVKHSLGVKNTTSSIMVLGDCGHYPPSISCKISLLCYLNRLENLSDEHLEKKYVL